MTKSTPDRAAMIATARKALAAMHRSLEAVEQGYAPKGVDLRLEFLNSDLEQVFADFNEVSASEARDMIEGTQA